MIEAPTTAAGYRVTVHVVATSAAGREDPAGTGRVARPKTKKRRR